MRADRQRDQAVQHVSVAADIPTGLKADLVMHASDGLHTGEVSFVEAPRQQPLPVRGLGSLQAGDLIANHLLEMRDARDVLVETVDDFAEAWLDHWPEGYEQRACSGV